MCTLLLGTAAVASVVYGAEDMEAAALWVGLVVIILLCTRAVVVAINAHTRRVQTTIHKRLPPRDRTPATASPQDERIARDDRVAHLRGS